MVKGQNKRKYTPEFRQGAVALVLKEKRSVKEAAAALGMPENTLNVWVSQARNGHGVFLPDEQKDLAARVRELEAENRRLRIERDILKKATAFFAKEDGSRP
jgi:transposase-like protein